MTKTEPEQDRLVRFHKKLEENVDQQIEALFYTPRGYETSDAGRMVQKQLLARIPPTIEQLTEAVPQIIRHRVEQVITEKATSTIEAIVDDTIQKLLPSDVDDPDDETWMGIEDEAREHLLRSIERIFGTRDPYGPAPATTHDNLVREKIEPLVARWAEKVLGWAQGEGPDPEFAERAKGLRAQYEQLLDQAIERALAEHAWAAAHQYVKRLVKEGAFPEVEHFRHECWECHFKWVSAAQYPDACPRCQRTFEW